MLKLSFPDFGKIRLINDEVADKNVFFILHYLLRD